MKKITILTTIILVASLSLIGCFDILQAPVSSDPSSGKGIVRLELGTPNGRTLRPAAYTFAAYKLTFEPVDTNGAKTTFEFETLGENDSFTLEKGKWDLLLEAFSDIAGTILVASGEVSNVVVGDSPDTVTVTLEFETGDGTLEYDINTEDLDFIPTIAAIILQRYNSSNAPINIDLLEGFSGEKTEIPSGFYELTIRLKDGGLESGGREAIWSDIAHIYANQTTIVSHTFVENNFFKSINKLWLVGLGDKWNDTTNNKYPNLEEPMNAELDGTFTWIGNVVINDRFRINLTDTSDWELTDPSGNEGNPWKGDWFAPVTDNTEVLIGDYTMPLVTGYTGTNTAWQFKTAGYYKITVYPYDNKFVVSAPAVVDSVTITPATASVYIYGEQKFTATVQGKNNPSQNVDWSITTTDLASGTELVDGEDGEKILQIAGTETKTTITIQAVSTADSSKSNTAVVTVKKPVVSVSVTGPTEGEQGTSSSQFFATANFEDSANIPSAVPKTVTLSVARESGNKEDGTTINSDGYLTIAESEAVGNLIITATSDYDTTKKNTATLLVKVPAATPKVLSVKITPNNDDSNVISILRGKTQQFAAVVTVEGGAAQTVAWTISGNTSSTNINGSGLLTVATDQFTGTSGTLTITATSTVTGFETVKDSVTVTIPAPVKIASPATAALSDEGVATWTAPSTGEDNIALYSVQLYKGTVTQGSAITVNKGATYSHNFLTAMRDAGVGAYKFSVTAITNDAPNYPSSDAKESDPQNVTQKNPVLHTWWNSNETARWGNPTGHQSTDSYTVKIYKKTAASNPPASLDPNDALVGEKQVNVRYNIPGESNTDATEWYMPADGVPSDSTASYYFTVALNGDNKLVLDSPVKISDAGTYNVLGTSKVWTVTEGTVNAAARYVAGAEHGKIAWSDDGQTWTMANQKAFTLAITSIAYGNGKFVAVGYDGKSAYSIDGKNWTSTNSNTNQTLWTVAYGNNLFITGGNGSIVRYSDNGEEWRTENYWYNNETLFSPSGNPEPVRLLLYNDATKEFLVFGEWGQHGKFNSTSTPPAWTHIANKVDNNDNVVSGAIGNGTVVILLSQSNNRLNTPRSSNLFGTPTWQWSPIGIVHSNDSTWPTARAVNYGALSSGGRFIAVGEEGKAAISNDYGASWSAVTNTGFSNTEIIYTALGMIDGRIILAGDGKIMVVTP